MFTNEELKHMMKLAGVGDIPVLKESDHIDLEIAVEPEDSGEPGDYGVPDNASEPLAPKFEEPMGSDEYGIPIDTPMPPEMGELPVDAVDEPVVVAISTDSSMGDRMSGDTDMDIDGSDGCDCGSPECGTCGSEPQAAMPMDQRELPSSERDMTSAFSSMPDDEFINMIQGGMPSMDDKMANFANEDGEGSPVGSDEVEEEGDDADEDLIEVEEEFDYTNGYDESYMTDGEEYFPSGHDSNVRRKGGPLPGRADNNLNTMALPVDDADEDDIVESLYAKYREEYAQFLKEHRG